MRTEREKEEERERLTCKTAEFKFWRGREAEKGLVASAYLAKSIEASSRKPALTDPYTKPMN